MIFQNVYTYLIDDLADPITKEWPLISSPLPLLIITTVYIYFVFAAGPRYMKNRPPFKLRNFILFYNLFQILVNAWLVWNHISAGWFTKYTLKCNNNNDPTSPNGFKIITIIWWFFLLKLFDLIETCIFVLRKKQNQVSALHVYHHVSNIWFAWHFLKYILEPRISLVSLINCAVHVIMYIYYFSAAWSTEMQQIMSPIKPHITKIQITQFIGIIIYGLQAFLDPECKGLSQAKNFIFILILNLLLFIYLFYDFYKKTYKKTYNKKQN